TYIASEIEKWGKVVKTARIKVDSTSPHGAYVGVRAASGHAVVAQARSALPLKTHMRARRLVEAPHGVGTAVFAGARGRSLLAPANRALWKVDEELDGVVQPSVVDFSRCDVSLLVFVEHLPASRLFLPLVPRSVGLALEHAVKQLIVRRRRVLQMGNL